MDICIKALILGVVEGLTEFLPISSTGHLIIVNRFLNFTGDFADMFDVAIQLGAILAVVAYFWKRLNPLAKGPQVDHKQEVLTLWKKTLFGVLPAIVLGGLFGGAIEEHLFNPFTVAIMLFVGGIVLWFLEQKKRIPTLTEVPQLTYRTAILIGCFQCLAMIPGTSRAAATIIGAMLLGASRGVAAEFSFFLAVPTMAAASGYTILKHMSFVSQQEWIALGIGFVTAFFTALAVIALFIRYIQTHDFKPFAYYRLILAVGILLFVFKGWL